MISTLRKKAHVWLRLLIILQVLGLMGHAAAWGAANPHVETSHLAGLNQILGYEVAICHHGNGDPHAPMPGSPGDCCAGGFCHCLSHVFGTPPSMAGLVAPLAQKIAARTAPHFTAPVLAAQIGSKSARGPPVSV